MPNKNYFAQLSPKQKAELFLIYTSNGMYNLDEIINHYNSEMDRAYSSTDKDMVARMHDVNAPYLLDEEGNKMTHRMASGDGYVFPTIQRNDNGELQSYENTEDLGAQRAIERNDTLQFRLPTLAEYFSENYKTHLDNPVMRRYGGEINSFAGGGLISNDGDGNNGIINGLGTNVRKLYGKAKQVLGIQNIPTESGVRDWTDDDIRNLARAFEGNSNKAYIGIKGDILGGYGHKLNTDEINKYWDSKNKKPTQNIDDDIIEEWLDSDIKKASDIVEKYYGNNLPSNIRAMLISLVYQGGELLIRGKRDETGAIREDWKGGSPKFEAALKAYLENKTQDGLQSVLEQMQYKDDGDNSISGMSSRYGLYRAMLENIADPENVYDYKYDGTFKLYKSNKVKK